MNKNIGAVFVTCGMIFACGTLWQKPIPVSNEEEKECECQKETEKLQTAFNACEEERIRLVEAPPTIKRYTKIVEKEGPPKMCVKKVPVMEAIETVELVPGYLCANEKNWTKWLLNELSCRKFIETVVACQKSE